MQFVPMHENFRLPEYGSAQAAAFDIFMPEPGSISYDDSGTLVKLGFAAAVPDGKAAYLLPRSGVGVKFGLKLNNTIGLIDPDYRGEWMVCLRLDDAQSFSWDTHDRLIQCVIGPVFKPQLEIVTELPPTARDTGGFGSTGN